MTWSAHKAYMYEMGNICTVLAGKSNEKRKVGKCRHRWNFNKEIDVGRVWC